MTSVHNAVGWVIPIGFGVLFLWSLWPLLFNRPLANAYWSLLGTLQGILALQVVVGGALYLFGGRPPTNGPEWLHYVYGGLFPAALLVAAHRFARKHRDLSWTAFGVASFLICGLTIRALMTGLGVD